MDKAELFREAIKTYIRVQAARPGDWRFSTVPPPICNKLNGVMLSLQGHECIS